MARTPLKATVEHIRHRANSPFPSRLQLDGFLDELGILVGVVNTGDVRRSQKGRSEMIRVLSDEVCPEIAGQV